MGRGLAILIIGLVAISSKASAAFLFSPSVSYSSKSRTDENGTRSEVKTTHIDFRFGYLSEFGLYLGGLYSLQDQEIFQGSSDSYMGPSVGYWWQGLFVVATYHLFGERDLTAGGVKYSRGSGLQIDLSYAVPVADNVFLGPQLSYQSLRFRDRQVNGVSEGTSYKLTDITPYFNLTFLF